MRKKLSLLLLTIGLLFVVVACGNDKMKETEKVEDPPEVEENEDAVEESGGITVTDLQGNTVEFDAVPERIVSLTAGDLSTIYDLGAVAVGRPIIRGKMSSEIEEIEEVGTSNDVNVEKIASLQPDVVIAHPQLNKDAIPALEELGIAIVQMGANSVDEVKQSIQILGELVQKEEKATELIKDIEEITSKSEETNEDALRTLVIFGSAGNWMAALPDSLSGGMLDAVGGYNIAKDYEKLERFPQYAQLDMEKIIEADPAVIFFITPGPQEETVKAFTEEMEQNPAWGNIKAIKEDHFISLPNNLFGANPGSHIIESLDYLDGELTRIANE